MTVLVIKFQQLLFTGTKQCTFALHITNICVNRCTHTGWVRAMKPTDMTILVSTSHNIPLESLVACHNAAKFGLDRCNCEGWQGQHIQHIVLQLHSETCVGQGHILDEPKVW